MLEDMDEDDATAVAAPTTEQADCFFDGIDGNAAALPWSANAPNWADVVAKKRWPFSWAFKISNSNIL
jgi:hypothetical protein